MKKIIRPRRAPMVVGAAVALIAGSLALSGASRAAVLYQASLDKSDFEIDFDANLTVDNLVSNPQSMDWTGGGGTGLRSGVQDTQDKDSGGGDDAFGGGTKEDTKVPKAVAGGIPPNKSDLKHFGIYQETSSDGAFLHLFWTRVQDPSGTTNMDFEFNHNKCEFTDDPVPVEVDGSDCSSNNITPERVDGDLLIAYDLSNGGTTATISIREWSGSSWGPSTATGTKATGRVNTTAIAATDSGGLGALSPRTFGEASIDLSLVFTGTECDSFGAAYLKSRSSDSFTSALKDFIAPMSIALSNCGAVSIHKVDDADQPLEDVSFSLFEDTDPDDGDTEHDPLEDVDTGLGCDTDSNGDCTINDVPFGDYWVVEDAPPAGHLPSPDQAVSIDRESPVPIELEFVNPRHLFKTIVIVCDESTDKLHPSAITINGTSAGSSLSTAEANTALLSEAALCGLTAGDAGGLTAGTHDADIVIQQ